MSDEKISAMPNAAALTGAELVPVVQGGANVKATAQNIANLAPAAPAGANPTASVGATAVNGAAGTFMRSDGAPPLVAGNIIAPARSLIYKIGQITTQQSHTGDTNETLLGSIKIPGGLLGPNGAALYSFVVSRITPGSAAATVRIRYGAANDLTGTATVSNVLSTGTPSLASTPFFTNRNATNSQIASNLSQLALVSTAVDTTADSYIVISGQLSNGADTISLEFMQVLLNPIGGN